MTLKQKLFVILLVMGIAPMILVAGISYYKTYLSTKQQGETTLLTMQATVTHSVNAYFDMLHAQTRTLAMSPDVVTALKDFTAGVAAFDPVAQPHDAAKLAERYTYQEQNTPGSAAGDGKSWMPTDPVELALQGIYISQNTHPIGEKQNLINPADGSAYAAVHARDHEYFKDLVEEFGLYDIFLVDKQTGRIVYTMFKEVDFMRSVRSGPVAESELGKVARRVLDEGTADTSYLSDFAPYMPSYNAPAGFIASPIFDENGTILGALLIQVPLNVVAATMKSAELLGTTGDAYVLDRNGMFVTQPGRLNVKPGDVAPQGILDVLAAMKPEDTAKLARFDGADGHKAIAALGPVEVHTISQHGSDAESTPNHSHLPWLVTVRIAEHELLAELYDQLKIGAFIILLSLAVIAGLVWYSTREVMKPIQRIGDALTQMKTNMQEQVMAMRAAIDGVVAAAEETSHQAVIVKKNSQRAAESSSSVAAAVEQMDTSILEINQNMAATDHKIFESQRKAEEAAGVVGRLEESATKIAAVLTIITDIADRTNLLALNAAIEAARAGEAGRGFAVVADEVRKLAENTITATDDIKAQVDAVKTTSTEAAQVLTGIRDAVGAVRENATAVSGAVNQQSAATSEISVRVNETVNEVRQVDQNMSGIEEAAHDTGNSANDMLEAVKSMEGQFGKMQRDLDKTLDEVGVARKA